MKEETFPDYLSRLGLSDRPEPKSKEETKHKTQSILERYSKMRNHNAGI